MNRKCMIISSVHISDSFQLLYKLSCNSTKVTYQPLSMGEKGIKEDELREPLLGTYSKAAVAVPTGSNGGKEGGAASSRNNSETHSTLQEFKAPEIIQSAAGQVQVQEALANYNEMRVLLVGKSGVGKSSFINCLLQVNKAPVGRVKPETSEVTEYVLTDVGAGDNTSDDKVKIRVYDTPGFGTKKKENEKFIKEIRKKCEIVDVIFLCIRMDDQLRAEDRQTIALLAEKFDDKFWGKCLIVFTRANMVRRMGQHKDESGSEKEYLKSVRDELKEEIRKVFEKTKVTLPPFVLAGAPEFTPEGRTIPSVDSDDQESVDWLPLVADELFKSGCSENAKAILLKSGWEKWAQVSAGTGAGTAMGVALGGGMMAVGVATLALPPLGGTVLAIGGVIIVVSLLSGGASVGSAGKAAVDKSKTKKRVDRALKKMKKE